MPTFDELITPAIYPWDTPKARELREKASRRRISAWEVTDNTSYPANPGFCIWCGKPLTKIKQRFCAGIRREARAWEVTYYKRDYMLDYLCTNAFMAWWCAVPKFKRVVFLRDKFTCQICGLHSTWTNKNGVVFPDLSLLACDHIYPFAKGGKTEFTNLQTLCRSCNSEKSDKVVPILQDKLLDGKQDKLN